MSEKVDIERLLQEGQTVQIKPQGYSMYPLFVPGRDEAVIRKAEPESLKKGDVVLYRRDHGILVLHRICRKKQNAFFMVGDNQKEIEGPLREDQIKGVMSGFVRNGKYRSVKHPGYVLFSRIWLFLRPIRPVISKTVAALKRFFRNFKK